MSTTLPDATTRVNEFLSGLGISGETKQYLGDRSLGILIQTTRIHWNYGDPCELKLGLTITTSEELAMESLTLFVYEKGGRLLRSGNLKRSKENKNEFWVNIKQLPDHTELEVQLA